MNEADRQMLLKAQALIEQRREWERGYSTRPPLGAGVMAANIEGQDRKKITLPEQAVIWASMGLSSMVYKRTGAFRLYVLARSLDPQGSGHVSIADLKQAALHLKVKYSTFYAWLAEAFACGVFVRVGEKTVRGVGENTVRVVPGNTVKVRSQEAAFKIFGCKFLDKTKSSIPLKRLFAKDWRARVFAAYVQANHNGEIISLEKLEDLTGIPARTLKKSNLGKFVTAKRQYSVLDRSADAVPGLNEFSSRGKFFTFIDPANGNERRAAKHSPSRRSVSKNVARTASRGRRDTILARLEHDGELACTTRQLFIAQADNVTITRLFYSTPKTAGMNPKQAARKREKHDRTVAAFNVTTRLPHDPREVFVQRGRRCVWDAIPLREKGV